MMRRGFTLVEILISMGLMALLVLGSLSLFAGSMRSLQRTDSDVTMTDQNSRAMRKISETLRQAVLVTVTNGGRTIVFNLPALTNSVDPVTGEKEIAMPPVSDGVTRGYNVDFGSGTLVDIQTGKVLMRNIYSRDTDPSSTLYNQTYQPFQLSTVHNYKALTINLVTRDAATTPIRTTRMKTTAILRNVP
jgi:prepilin-type N-terminal cleavage/methylation domain-containing protein